MLPKIGTCLCVATILASPASSFGAELRSGIAADDLERIFVGTPTQLTLPPGFPSSGAASTDAPCESDVDIRRSNNDAANEAPHDGAGCSVDPTGTTGPPQSSREAAGDGDTREAASAVDSSKRGSP
jgi:hypothetical protein